MPYVDNYGITRPSMGDLIKLLMEGHTIKIESYGGTRWAYRMKTGELEVIALDGNNNPYHQEWSRADNLSTMLVSKLIVERDEVSKKDKA